MSSKKKFDVEAAAAADPTPKIVAADVAEVQKRREERIREHNLQQLETRLSSAEEASKRTVNILRHVREAEKRAKAYAQAMGDAKEQFIADADWDAYQATQTAAYVELFKDLNGDKQYTVKQMLHYFY